MLTMEDERDLARAEAFQLEPFEETIEEDEAFWEEADRRAEEKWLERL